MTRRKRKLEDLMDEGIRFMVREATERWKAGEVDPKEFLMVINCAMRWEKLRRELAGKVPEEGAGAAIDKIRRQINRALDATRRP
jgi:hypothetical protein